MHLHRVFRDSDGTECVIRSGTVSPWLPWFGDMKAEVSSPIAASADAPGNETPDARASTSLEVLGLSEDKASAVMVKYALPVGVTSEEAAGVSNDPQIPGEAPPSVGGAVRGTAGADQAGWIQVD